MIENHQEKENDADDVAEHGQLDIRDHLFAEKTSFNLEIQYND